MQDLEELPLVLMPVEYYLRRMVETECAEAQIKTQVVLEMNFPLGILQAVAEKGRTLRLYLTVRPIETCRPGLWGVDLYDPVLRHSVGWPTGVIDTKIWPRGNSAPSVEPP